MVFSWWAPAHCAQLVSASSHIIDKQYCVTHRCSFLLYFNSDYYQFFGWYCFLFNVDRAFILGQTVFFSKVSFKNMAFILGSIILRLAFILKEYFFLLNVDRAFFKFGVLITHLLLIICFQSWLLFAALKCIIYSIHWLGLLSLIKLMLLQVSFILLYPLKCFNSCIKTLPMLLVSH